jgi:serine/threonine protein kinase
MKRIGKYSIVETIGKGGMGVVYRAVDTVLEREVALKVQRYVDTPDDQSLARFFREAKLIASLRHRNIVTIYDMGQDDDKLYIVMELLRGEDLSTKLASGEHLSLELRIHIVSEVAEGLSHAHRKGIVHRDIKPRNVFLTEDGEVKLLDFGLAHIAHSTLTEAGQLLGTPHYMSPEQVKGESSDPRSDVFALGAVFYELLTGTKAFGAEGVQAVFDRIVKGEPRPVAELQPALPRELNGILAKALAKDRRDRYATIEELLRDLREFRQSVEHKKRDLRKETRRAARELARLSKRHGALLTARGYDPSPGKLAENADRADLSYMALVGLRRSASLEIERMHRVIAGGDASDSGDITAIRPSPPVAPVSDPRADEAYQDAIERFARGDLAGSLLRVGEVFGVAPDHRGAQDLSEHLREAIIVLVNRIESDASDIDALGRAILALDSQDSDSDVSGSSPSQSESHVDRGTVETLSRIFLAGLPPDKEASP